MPTGTRNSISANSATKPIMATVSVLMSFDRLDLFRQRGLGHQLLLEDKPPGADGDEQYGGYVPDPRQREERPGRQAQIEGEHVVVIGAAHLVEQSIGLHRHDEEQDDRGKDVDHALVFRADIGPDQIDRNMRAAVGGRGDAPEDENAEHHAAAIVGVRDRVGEDVAQQHLHEDIERDDADKERRDQYDRVDEPVHVDAFHASALLHG